MRILLALLALLIAGAVGATGAGAQEEGTPAVAVATVVPAAEECQVAPRSVESLAMLVGTPAAAEATPGVGGIEPIPLPEGTPADAATVDGINATLRELGACRNAGDRLRELALYTDDYFRRVIARQGPYSPEVLASLSTPQPPQETGIVLARPDDVRVLADGRVGALLLLPGEARDAVSYPFFVFARHGDRWLLDEVLLAVPPSPATPIA
jgi:hypothetical protein